MKLLLSDKDSRDTHFGRALAMSAAPGAYMNWCPRSSEDKKRKRPNTLARWKLPSAPILLLKRLR